MRVARVAAQAKVNLFLTVGARREDGYHDIVSMFQLLDLADDIVVRVGGAGRTLHVAGPRLPSAGLGATDKNLAYRAALAYADRAEWLQGFSIELNKNVPTGGGLGGGSSDAGAVLRALDALSDAPLGHAALLELAAGLGSDVPFFASGSARALGVGRGEQIGELDPLTPKHVLLLVPAFGVATADAYRWLDDAEDAERRSAKPSPASIRRPGNEPAEVGSNEWEFVRLGSHNDFEPVVERRHPELRRYREALTGLGAYAARLSGSGSTVFGIFDRFPDAPPNLGDGVSVIRTRTSARVVPVVVQE